MPLSNYYEILGLKTGAGSLEIKTAFRRLAKLYHPDKNPAGKEHFEKILRAYEVLSDPTLRSTYDYRLNYQSHTQQRTADRTTKTWSFDEKEMKRRQYYNEHIKKYAKATASHEAEPEPKKTYNEYKYVMLATPIAVVLFLLLMHLATPSGIKHFSPPATASTLKATATARTRPQTGDAPYDALFGKIAADSLVLREAILRISNESGYDAIVCLFKQQQFLKSCFIASGKTFTLEGLPKGPWQIRYSTGFDFDGGKKAAPPAASGVFTDTQRLYRSSQPLAPKELRLSRGATKGFERITTEEFFEKE